MDKLMLVKLLQAQKLLAEVYDYACKNDLDEVERLMSFADTCIFDAMETFEVDYG